MEEPVDESTRPVKGRRGLTVSTDAFKALALGLIMIALLVVGIERALIVRHDNRIEADGRAALSAARAEVLALTTISADAKDEDIARILKGATKDFRAQFEQQATTFSKALREGKVTSTGEIVSSGLSTLKGKTAEVLVAATGSVKNKDTEDAQQRYYRLRVSLEKVGGEWLVSGMEFVS